MFVRNGLLKSCHEASRKAFSNASGAEKTGFGDLLRDG
jgi:hypothetical protein